MTQDNSIDNLLRSLQERAKELNCIYQIEEILGDFDPPLEHVCNDIIKAIPSGWQYSDYCYARIRIEGNVYQPSDFKETIWFQQTNIVSNEVLLGEISVYYTKEFPEADSGPFLKEEAKLIGTIAERISHFVSNQKMKVIVQDWERRKDSGGKAVEEWRIVINMLKQTDRNLYNAITRKMLNRLCWGGIPKAEEIIQNFGPAEITDSADQPETWNQPLEQHRVELPIGTDNTIYDLAAENLSDKEILNLIQRWIYEDKLSFLVHVVNRNLSLAEVSDAIRRYHHLTRSEPGAKSANEIGICVSLIRRFLSEQLHYINVIKNYIGIKDFYHLLKRVIFVSGSHGRFGGKSAGLYLASQIIKHSKGKEFESNGIKIPKTWHITSDVLLHFMHYNNFEEVVEQKYKDINQVRLEYPRIVETFKRAPFPPEVAQGLSMALDDLGDMPLIVRSSSLLEDRVGATFSGKYKSLFLGNQGTKKERLEALMDAVAEVYASTFSPDPIEYRAERGLLDFGEEMGIIIQEVVGKIVGKYFLPAFAGVIFSRNEFRWSPRIKREDGLVRMVPGLGTRAVDRLSDDYPVLFSPGQPNLKVNVEPDEIYKYSPKRIDVINLETNKFETVNFLDFIKTVKFDMPAFNKIISVYSDHHISRCSGLNVDFENEGITVTFDGLINDTSFVKQIKNILATLENAYGHPIDIEFAHNGDDLYLLQCRSQSYSEDAQPAPIPKDVPKNKIVFTANKYVPNGRINNISHLVYVDPDSYAELSSRQDMLSIGRVISGLNKLLPKRQFILIGPGRWGSRGDIKLGVSVTYSDINNCAALIEVARKKGNYVPDLSFGTHFFQDLVEAGIRYLPLYPDDDRIIFNENLLKKAANILPELLPEFSHFADTVRLVDIPQCCQGNVLRVLMNADLDEAIAIIDEPSTETDMPVVQSRKPIERSDEFWQWRMTMVERLAREIDPARFGVVALYLLGSTKNATAGPGSDIDILLHCRGNSKQLELLNNWLQGWSLCLAEMNYMRTGYKSDGILDVHIITDEDIKKKTSFACKIGAVTDPARKMPIGKTSD